MYHVYCRVSTGEQARDTAVSLPEQTRKGNAVATLYGASRFDVAVWTDAGVSGTIALTKRPAGGEMWSALQDGDTVIAAKLDRLFRSSSDALTMMERFKERNISVILIDMGTSPVQESATAKLFFTMLAAFAAFERDVITQRCKDGLIGKRNRGGAVGGTVPYGYDKVGVGQNAMLVENQREQEIVDFIMRRWPRRSQTQILAALKREGYLNRKGTDFQYVQLGRIHKYHSGRRKWDENYNAPAPAEPSTIPITEGGFSGKSAQEDQRIPRS